MTPYELSYKLFSVPLEGPDPWVENHRSKLFIKPESPFQGTVGKVLAGLIPMMTEEHQRGLVRFHCVVTVCRAEPNPTSWAQKQTRLPLKYHVKKCEENYRYTRVGGRAARIHRLQWQQTITPYQPYVFEATGLRQTWTPSLKFCTSVYKVRVMLMSTQNHGFNW